MTTKYVEWCSFSKLPCSFASRKDVVLCLQSSDLVAPINCPSGAEDQYRYAFIDAQVCQAFTQNVSCSGGLWHYKFSYDDTLLAEGVTALTSADIVGAFCKNCETDWTESIIGDEIQVVTNIDGSNSIISQHGCVFALGGTAGQSYTFLSTESIDITDCGSPDHTVSAFVNISADANNAVSVHWDGLFVDTSNLVDPTIHGSFTMHSSSGFVGDTLLGADTYRLYFCPGGNIEDPARGAYLTIYGNNSGIGIPGGMNIAMGNVAGAHIDIGVNGAASSYIRMYGAGVLKTQWQFGCAIAFKDATSEASGVGAALLGANCPAVTVAAPYTWLKVQTSDGSTGYIPIWK